MPVESHSVNILYLPSPFPQTRLNLSNGNRFENPTNESLIREPIGVSSALRPGGNTWEWMRCKEVVLSGQSVVSAGIHDEGHEEVLLIGGEGSGEDTHASGKTSKEQIP